MPEQLNAPVSIPVTSETARDALQYTFGLNRLLNDTIDLLGKVPVLAQTGDTRIEKDMRLTLRRMQSTINEMTGAGKPTAATTGLTSQRPAPVPPQEALNEVV